jgi:hypothetical protein
MAVWMALSWVEQMAELKVALRVVMMVIWMGDYSAVMSVHL